MGSFRCVMTFKCALLTGVNLRMGYAYALLLMKSLCIFLAKDVVVGLFDDDDKLSIFFFLRKKHDL